MLIEGLLPNVRDDIFAELKGPVSIRITLWYKARGACVKAVAPLTPPAWDQCQKGAKAAGDKIEPVVRAGVEPILKAKEELKDKVRSTCSQWSNKKKLKKSNSKSHFISFLPNSVLFNP